MNKIQDIREKIMEARTGEKGVPNEKERFTLADVLLALNKNTVDLLFTTSFQHPDKACIIPPPDRNHEDYPKPGHAYWNLKQTLENQPKDCIDFLLKVFTKI